MKVITKLWTILFVIVLAAHALPVGAQDGEPTRLPQPAESERVAGWYFSGTIEEVLMYTADVQRAALGVDGIDKTGIEWIPWAGTQRNHAIIWVYYPAAWGESLLIWEALMWRLTAEVPERWGHLAPYLDPAADILR